MVDQHSGLRYPIAAALLLQLVLPAGAAEEPYGLADITLGASWQALAASLDLRDIHAAISEQAARKAARPDLGRRGYGCVRRDDAYADVSCVSHDEKVGGAQAREIRLQFLNGVLQQFSISADIPHFDAVMAALRAEHGPPQAAEAATEGRYASYRWANGVSSIVAYGGKDVVFVSFELATYPEAVKRRQQSGGGIVIEPR